MHQISVSVKCFILMRCYSNCYVDLATSHPLSITPYHYLLNNAKSCNEKLKMEHETTVTTAAKLADDTATSVGQLEKDIEEEFQVSTQLKRDMEDLKKKFTKEDNEEGANEIENLLASLRMVQVWQLSHFQRIGNLVFKNKEHARGLQSL